MFAHYLTTALRSFWRNRISTTVNVLGLALGLVCLIGAYSFTLLITHGDGGFAKADRIHFITTHLSRGGKTNQTVETISTPAPFARHLAPAFPELEAIARTRMSSEMGATADGKSAFVKGLFVDPALLRIFDFSFVAGDAVRALDRPGSAVLTEEGATKIFGSADVLGRSFSALGETVTVTGVMRPVSKPSHFTQPLLQFDVLISMDVDEKIALRDPNSGARLDSWTSQSYLTYVLAPSDGFSLDLFNHRLLEFSGKVVPNGNGRVEFHASPIAKFEQISLNGLTRVSGLSSDTLIVLLGALVMALACINFANLVAAQTVSRMREAALRRVVGARRIQLVTQHLFETTTLIVAAFLISFAALTLLLPALNSFFGFAVFPFLARISTFWLFLALAVATVMAAAGIYPALLVARISPETVARGTMRYRKNGGAQVLVCVQFAAVSLLVTLALIVAAENRKLQDLGLKSSDDPIAVISANVTGTKIDIESLRTELTRSPHVKAVGAVLFVPWSPSMSATTIQKTADLAAELVPVNYHVVAGDFFGAAGINIIAGRAFSTEHGGDVVTGDGNPQRDGNPRAIVIDRATAAKFGWQPSEAVGKTLFQSGDLDRTTPPSPMNVIGVSENTPIRLLSPFSDRNIYFFSPTIADIPLIRLKPKDLPAGLATIDAAWANLASNAPMKRQYWDDLFQNSFKTFATISRAIFTLSLLAFVIALIGLIGMAIYATERLKRDIGIRKALGAGIREAIGLMLWGFSKPVVIANILAWPIVYMAAKAYLSLFVVRIPLTPMPFVLGLLISLAVTWIAVGWQAYAAARVNPADVLHYE